MELPETAASPLCHTRCRSSELRQHPLVRPVASVDPPLVGRTVGHVTRRLSLRNRSPGPVHVSHGPEARDRRSVGRHPRPSPYTTIPTRPANSGVTNGGIARRSVGQRVLNAVDMLLLLAVVTLPTLTGQHCDHWHPLSLNWIWWRWVPRPLPAV